MLLLIFSYLPQREVGRLARVCRKWRTVSADSRLWTHVSLRPEVSGLHVSSIEKLLALISVRFGLSLRYIELPIELITHTVLHELGNKCPNLTHMLLDFSTAMQLHDFNDLHTFPTKLRVMCICLSEVIFMEGFMRKIYNFINGLEVLHLIGECARARRRPTAVPTAPPPPPPLWFQARTKRLRRKRRKSTRSSTFTSSKVPCRICAASTCTA